MLNLNTFPLKSGIFFLFPAFSPWNSCQWELKLLWMAGRCMVLSISSDESHSLLNRILKHPISSWQQCCRYFSLTCIYLFILLPVFESNESLIPVLKSLSSWCRLALRPVRYALRRACTVCAAFARSEKKAKEGGQHSGARSAGVRGT